MLNKKNTCTNYGQLLMMQGLLQTYKTHITQWAGTIYSDRVEWRLGEGEGTTCF